MAFTHFVVLLWIINFSYFILQLYSLWNKWLYSDFMSGIKILSIYVINIVKYRYFLGGHHTNGKSQPCSVLHQLLLVWGSSLFEWESASCFWKRLMIILSLSEHRFLHNNCRKLLFVKLLFQFRMCYCQCSQWVQLLISKCSAMSQCRDLFCLILWIRLSCFSSKHTEETDILAGDAIL